LSKAKNETKPTAKIETKLAERQSQNKRSGEQKSKPKTMINNFEVGARTRK
jgi:hypothetical protein